MKGSGAERVTSASDPIQSSGVGCGQGAGAKGAAPVPGGAGAAETSLSGENAAVRPVLADR